MVMFFSIVIGKIIRKVLIISGRTGSALPGLIVEKINPNILVQTLGQLPQGVIIVSGTNGKTTTTKILTHLLEAQGLKVLTNKTGSNFVRGIISVIIEYAKLNGKLSFDIAVFEQDEAHAVLLAQKIKPRGVVALNVMRDQMDRFGEIDTTTKMLQKLVGSATEWVVLNANDERISTLKPAKGVTKYWYGYAPSLLQEFLSDDQLYDAKSAKYFCAGKPVAELYSYKDGTVTITMQDENKVLDYALGGSHNAINLTSALVALHATRPKKNWKYIDKAVSTLVPAFGRGESFKLKNGIEITLQLVKNPAGFMHALRMVRLKPYGITGIAINDDYADGRDVSWLWDVDFSVLRNHTTKILCGGTRGDDMALRLKYDEIVTEKTVNKLKEFVRTLNELAIRNNDKIIIFCTYTAMLEIRQIYKEYSDTVYEVEV